MRVLMTGGTGFVGQAMSDKLDSDAELLNRREYCADWWQPLEWEYIIHLAPVLPDRVIECAKRCGARILFSSSGAAYAEHPTEYGKMKIQAERMLAESGVDYVVARMFAFMGPHMKWDNFAVGNFIRDAERGGPINIMGDGQAVRSYLYASDMASWMWTILLHGKSGETYDVGSMHPIRIGHLAELVSYHYIPRPQINTLNKIAHEPALVYLPYNLNKTKYELGVTQTIGIDEMLNLTIEAYRNEN